MEQTKVKICVECGEREARHWNSSFCEECFIEILNYNLDHEGEEQG